MFSNYFYNRMKAAYDRTMKEEPPGKIEDPLCPDDKADLNVILLGDPQFAAFIPHRQTIFAAAANDINSAKGEYDSVIILGDITENGAKCEFRFAKELIDSFASKTKSVICITGNHDVRFSLYHKRMKAFKNFVSSLIKGVPVTGKHYYFTKEINGYKFISMGSDMATLEATHLSKKQLDWLDREIASANGKPVFVLNHQAIKHTNGLPDCWQSSDHHRGSIGHQSDKVRAIFEKYKNVYFITGHLHMAAWEGTLEDYGAFKAISVPTTGGRNHSAEGPQAGENPQYLVMTVYKDRVVVRNRLGRGVWAPETQPGGYHEYKID